MHKPTPAEMAERTPPAQTPAKYFSGIQANNAECVRCHKAFEPEHYADEQWVRFLPKHCKDVKIDPATARQILGYLTKYN